jgi:hypothetical protein
MNGSAISIQLDGSQPNDRQPDGGQFGTKTRVYQPGGIFSGQYTIDAANPSDVGAVEVSVLWYSEGKGDEDLAVHEFWRKNAEDGDFIDPRRPERFSTTLPQSPLSYDGRIVKICWCVRVRAFVGRKEIVAEEPFQLGSVPSQEEEVGEETS